MTLVAFNTTPSTCPDCGGALSMPLGSKARPGMVVQTCKNYQVCGRAVWSAVGTVITEPVIDDGSRHARFLMPESHRAWCTRTGPRWEDGERRARAAQ